MKKIIFGLIMILGLSITLTPVYGGPITLKAVTFLPKNDNNLVAWKAFIEDVNKKLEKNTREVLTVTSNGNEFKPWWCPIRQQLCPCALGCMHGLGCCMA